MMHAEEDSSLYTAVPLAPSDEEAEDNEQQRRRPLIRSKKEAAEARHAPQKRGHFVAGALLGIACFAVVHAAVLPSLPHLQNVLADSAVSAFVWSIITTATTYGLWFAFIGLVRSCRSKATVRAEDEDREEEEDEAFWQDMEYPFAVGVFLGFSGASSISLAREGVPMIYVSLVLLSALLWTRAMAWAAADDKKQKQQEQQQQKQVTIAKPILV